jgi:hypothetical protein
VARISRFQRFLRLGRGAKSFESGRAGWRSARYEPDRSILNLVDCVAVIPANRSIPFQIAPVLDPCWTLGNALAPKHVATSASPKDYPRSVHIFPSGLKIRPVLRRASVVNQNTKPPSLTDSPEILTSSESAKRETPHFEKQSFKSSVFMRVLRGASLIIRLEGAVANDRVTILQRRVQRRPSAWAGL